MGSTGIVKRESAAETGIAAGPLDVTTPRSLPGRCRMHLERDQAPRCRAKQRGMALVAKLEGVGVFGRAHHGAVERAPPHREGGKRSTFETHPK